MSIRFNTRKAAARKATKGPASAYVATAVSYLPTDVVRAANSAQRAAAAEKKKQDQAKAEKVKANPKKTRKSKPANDRQEDKLMDALEATNKLVADLAQQVSELAPTSTIAEVLEHHQKGRVALK